MTVVVTQVASPTVTVQAEPTFGVTVQAPAARQVVQVSAPGPQGQRGLPGAGNATLVIVSPTDPALTDPGLWIQTDLGPTGDDMTFWVEDGV